MALLWFCLSLSKSLQEFLIYSTRVKYEAFKVIDIEQLPKQ